MTDYDKIRERAERGERLKQARLRADTGGVKATADRFGWDRNTYKAHDSGRNGFDPATAIKYAKAFGVSANWLMFGTGTIDDDYEASAHVTDVPLVTWVSAGALTNQDAITDLSDFPTMPITDLPDGDWIALRVEGDSMNRISPHGSIVLANRRDRRLVHNACYIVADETGAATYKRWRQNEGFHPVSTEAISPPAFEGAVHVVGRVRRSLIDM